MKARLLTSLAVAAIATMSLSGCGLVAPQATLQPYAPSDGVELNVADVEVRNLMLVTDEDANEFNLVFAAMNNAAKAVTLGFRMVDADGAEIGSADAKLDPMTFTSFGDLEGDFVTVDLKNVEVGSMVVTYVQTPGGEQQISVPVIDGTLRDEDGAYAFPEYAELVP